MTAVSCTIFRGKKRRGDAAGLIAVHGDSSFLRREARKAVREWVVADGPADFLYSSTMESRLVQGFSTNSFTARSSAIEDSSPSKTPMSLSKSACAEKSLARHRRSESCFSMSAPGRRHWLAQAVTLAIQCSAPKEHLLPGGAKSGANASPRRNWTLRPPNGSSPSPASNWGARSGNRQACHVRRRP